MLRPEQVTLRDLELLSCSLDNALSLEEQVEFKKRLAQSPHLRQKLEEQKQLKRALSALPARRLPRNFTLTRAEAQKAKKRGFLQPLFGWPSAVMALAVMVVFGREVLFNNFAAQKAAPQAEQASYSLDSVVMEEASMMEEDELAGENDTVYLINWAGGGMGGGALDGMGGATYQQGSSGVSLNISVADIKNAEISDTAAGMTTTAEGSAIDVQEPVNPPNTGGGALTIEPAETTAQMPEDVQPEEARADANREAPAIFGIDPANLGQVIAEAPFEELPSEASETSIEEEVQSQEEAAYPENALREGSFGWVKWALLAAALLLGLVWLILKIKSRN